MTQAASHPIRTNAEAAQGFVAKSRHWGRALLIILALAILGLFAARYIVEYIIVRQLKAAVAKQLDATLEVGSISYYPPLRARVSDVKLLIPDQKEPYFVAQAIDVTLNKVPLGGGPIVIRSIGIIEPSITLEQQTSGFTYPKPRPSNKPPKNPEDAKALSSQLELRNVRVIGGEVRLLDKTGPDTLTTAWDGFDADMKIDPVGPGEYKLNIGGGNGDVSSLGASVRINLDTLDLELTNLTLKATVAPNVDVSQLPPQLQRLVNQYKIQGQATVLGSATTNLKTPAKTGFDVQVALENGALALPQLPTPIDSASVVLYATRAVGNDVPIDIAIETLAAQAGRTDLRVTQMQASFDLQKRSLLLSNLVGIATSAHPESQASPVKQIDEFDITGSLNFVASGEARLDGNVPDFRVQADLSSGALASISRNLELNNLSIQASIDPEIVNLDSMRTTIAGGVVAATGKLRLDSARLLGVDANLIDLDISQLDHAARGEIEGTRYSGRLNGTVHASALLSARDIPASVRGSGNVVVREGDFFRIPVVSDLVRFVNKGAQTGTVGSIDAIFSVADSKVSIREARVNSPVVGITANGNVQFDGTLGMRAIIAPLGAWGDRVKVAGLSQIAGGMQQLLDKGTSVFLYQVDVYGPAAKPVITPVPVPIISDTAIGFFKSITKKEK